MKELKRAEKIYNEEFNIEIKPYLTMAEIELIVEKMAEKDNVVHRQIIKDMLVLKFCTNIENVDELDYDLAVESGLMGTVINTMGNYHDVDCFLDDYESINRSVARFLESVANTADKAVDKMPKTPKAWEKLIGQLGDVVKKNDK